MTPIYPLRWIVPPSTSHADVALLRDDYVRVNIVNAVPLLFLNTHINAENRQKMETIKERFLPLIIVLSSSIWSQFKADDLVF